MFSTRTITLQIAILIVAMAPNVAMALDVAPASWLQVSVDGRYVLVMVSPLPVDEDAGSSTIDGKEIQNIRSTYSQSGLYHNDGTDTPIWTLPYSGRHQEVFIGPNGTFVVFADSDWNWSNEFDGFGRHVVSFYSNGNKLASYSITDLVSSIQLKSLIHWQRVNFEEVVFDANSLTLASRTNHGEEFVFDVASGKMIRHSSPFPMYIGLVTIGIAMAVIYLVRLIRRGRDAVSATETPA